MNKYVLAGVLTLFLAGFFRFTNLNAWPVFADESIYVRWSQVMATEPTLRYLPLTDGKQPLFMWLLMPILKLFTDPLIAGRLLAALSGLAVVVGIMVLMWQASRDSQKVITAGLLAATMPFLVMFDRLALADSMLAMWLLWGVNFYLFALKNKRFDGVLIAGWCMGMAWLTKSPAVYGLLFLGLLTLAETKASLIRRACYLAVASCIAFAMYNTLRLGPQFHMIALRNADYLFSLKDLLARPWDPFMSHIRDSFAFWMYLIHPWNFGLALAGLILALIKRQKLVIVLALFAFLPVLINSGVAKQYTARYILYTIPYLIFIIAYAYDELFKSLSKKLYGCVLFVVCGLLFIHSSLLLFKPEFAPMPKNERSGYFEEWTAGFGLREVSSYLVNQAETGPVLVGSEGFFGTPFSALEMYTTKQKNIRVIGVGVWIDSIHQSLTNSLKDNKVYLVVNSERFHADWTKLKLNLLASYPKFTKSNGQYNSLLFFEVLP